jgi:hypothetical protein
MEIEHATQPVASYSRSAPPIAEGTGDDEIRGRVIQGAVRGAIASMAMTGLREVTRRVSLLEEPLPESILRQKVFRRLRTVKHGRPRVQAELLHWSYGAAAGAVFAALPAALRRSAWSGPAFGLLMWTGFELGIAPVLGLSQARRVRIFDRLALVGDHLFYGYILSESASLRPAGR